MVQGHARFRDGKTVEVVMGLRVNTQKLGAQINIVDADGMKHLKVGDASVGYRQGGVAFFEKVELPSKKKIRNGTGETARRRGGGGTPRQPSHVRQPRVGLCLGAAWGCKFAAWRAALVLQ